ncbi:hypothetical protein AUF17_04000 [Enterococcus avium]|uniref:DUF1642 domain-containing protein n=1 Tax=Enterococcus avium TaxID=33945 RepID=A0A8B5VXZ8_ENTAV|nr:DUF1642 domain-containing protein [Enterococcus avium]TRZ33283.1 hypothetical protein AUF17_04000 [Enterococcus avium]
MNKQKLIEGIKKEKYDFSKPETSLDSSDYKEGYNDASDDILDIIKQLDEPQKVKVPASVAEKMKRYKSALWMLSSEYFDTSSEVDSDELANWIDQNSETFFRAWLDGYEVEEEPKWVLKHQNGMYFTRFNEEMEPLLGGEKRAYRFTDESKAEALTIFFNGTVEKV